ncbi:hypothetical protein CsatB_017953 [Cannabis sativa]
MTHFRPSFFPVQTPKPTFHPLRPLSLHLSLPLSVFLVLSILHVAWNHELCLRKFW